MAEYSNVCVKFKKNHLSSFTHLNPFNPIGNNSDHKECFHLYSSKNVTDWCISAFPANMEKIKGLN